jgi:hypothetical protein
MVVMAMRFSVRVRMHVRCFLSLAPCYNQGPPDKLVMQRAGSVIGSKKALAKIADPEMRACAAWALAAGKNLSKHTRAVALVRGRLIVEVDDFLLQQQMMPLRGQILDNLARELGEVLVVDVDLRPTPPRRQPQPASSARPGGIPNDADGIEDPVLAMLYRRARRKA